MFLFANKVVSAVLLSAFLAQGLKIIFNMYRDKKFPHPIDLVVTGGMPSAHSALVSSLLAILFLTEGFSIPFAISLVIFIIVITDSMGVRRTAGEEAAKVNQIIVLEKLKLSRIHYSLGHKPFEVLVGIFIGFLVAIFVYLL